MSRLDKAQRTLIERFDQAWRSGRPPNLARSLPKLLAASPGLADSETRREFLTELVSIDLEYRWRRSNEGTAAPVKTYLLEDYASALPQLGSIAEMPLELIAAEYRARNAWGDAPTTESYVERFPSHGPVLAQRLAEVEQETAASGAKLPRIEGLKLLSKIGRGSFGVVYKAKQVDAKRTVAVKVVQIDSDEDKEAFARFLKEAQAIARIKHPNVVTLYHSGMTELRPYLVMEYASGGTLRHRLHTWRQKWGANLPPDQTKWQKHVASLVHDLARGLAAAHAQQVVHRDLKPENILFDAEQHPMIADFGLARETDEAMSTRGAGEGTREYQAPEQIAREKRVDVRADIYSVGVILFELLTGELPFNGPLVEAQVADTARYAPTPREINPNVNRDLEAICEKCLQKSPEKRFESATALADDLNRFLEGEPILTRPITGRERVQRFLWFHRVAVGFSAALLLSVTIGGGVGVRQYLENRRIDLERTASLREQDRLKQEGEALAAKKQVAEEAAKQKDVKIAEQQERVEQEQSATAIAKRNNQLHEYASDMQTVQRSWNEGNQSQVAELLVRHDPSKNGGASDVRGFEWYYWNHLLHQKDGTIQNGAACRCLAVDKTGSVLAVSDFENVTLWNLESGAQLWRKPVTGRRQSMFSQDRSIPTDRSVAFSPDGKRVAGVGFVIEGQRRLGILKVWDTQSGDEVFSVQDDPAINGRTLVFAPDGDRVLAGGYMNGWKSWNLSTKQADVESAGERDQDAGARPRPGSVGANAFEIVSFLGFSEDGRRLFASGHARIPTLSWLWENTDRQPLRPELRGVREWGGRLPAGIVRAASNDRWRVVNTEGSKLHFYFPSRRSLGRPIGGAPGRDNPPIQDTVISPPATVACVDILGPHLVAGGTDQLVYLWQLNDGNGDVISSEVLRGHRGAITSVTVSPEGKPVSGDEGGEIRLWTDRQPEVVTVDGGSQAMTIAPHPERGEIEVTNRAGSVVGKIPMEKGEHVFGARPSASERFVMLSMQGNGIPPRHRLLVWDLHESRAVLTHVYGPKLLTIDDIAMSGDEGTMAAVTDGQGARLWSTKTGAELGSFSAPEFATLVLNDTGSLLAVGGNQRLLKESSPIQVWDVARHEKLCQITIDAGESTRRPLFVFSADAEKLIVDGNPSTLWDVRTGEQLPATLGDILADSAQTSQDRRRLYFITGDTVEICCAKTFRPLLKFTMKVTGRSRELSRRDAVGGARGFWASEVLDRRLTQLVERWRHEDAR